MNDESKTIRVKVMGMNQDIYEVSIEELKPHTSKVFTFDAPNNSIPFVKKWDYDMVLISYCADVSLLEVDSTKS